MAATLSPQRTPPHKPAKLSTLFTHEFVDREAGPLWRRFKSRRRRADRDALFEFYAPWVRLLAYQCKRRRPEYYKGCLDDMLSDGSIGLLKAIEIWDETRC